MSWASCCCAVSPSAAAVPAQSNAVTRAVDTRPARRRPDTALAFSIFETISPSDRILIGAIETAGAALRQGQKSVHICGLAKLFCILDRDHLDLDQKAG